MVTLIKVSSARRSKLKINEISVGPDQAPSESNGTYFFAYRTNVKSEHLVSCASPTCGLILVSGSLGPTHLIEARIALDSSRRFRR